MNVGSAAVTARLVGPEGDPRVGRISFQPLYEAWTRVLGAEKAAVIGATRADLDYEGRMPRLTLAAPASLPDGAHNYLVVVESPGDPRAPRRYRARILADQTYDLTDLVSDVAPAPQPGPGPTPPGPPQPSPHPLIRDAGNGMLTADATAGVNANPDGLLNWRNDG